jgi:hypothetical protein
MQATAAILTSAGFTLQDADDDRRRAGGSAGVPVIRCRDAVVSHLAGAVLLSAGFIIALPAISGPLHRTWVTVRRAFPVRGSPRPLQNSPGPIHRAPDIAQ